MGIPSNIATARLFDDRRNSSSDHCHREVIESYHGIKDGDSVFLVREAMLSSILVQLVTERFQQYSKNDCAKWVLGWTSTVKQFIRAYHGTIKMTRFIPMFGKRFQIKNFSRIKSSRYTSSKDKQSLYACLLVWPTNTTELVLGAPIPSSNTVVSLLGSSMDPLKWRPMNETTGMIIDLSTVNSFTLASHGAWVFKLQHLKNH